jgi:hypothetical protein
LEGISLKLAGVELALLLDDLIKPYLIQDGFFLASGKLMLMNRLT